MQANRGSLTFCTSVTGITVIYFPACMSLVCVCVLQQITIRIGSISLSLQKFDFIFFLFFGSLFNENHNFLFPLHSCLTSTSAECRTQTSHLASLNDCTGLSQMQPQSLHEGFEEISRKASASSVQEDQHQKFL